MVSSVAIVGAGVSGLYLARLLHDAGHVVTVFEKSRGPGGRLCGRRVATAQHDMGAPYVSYRTESPWSDRLLEWEQAGVLARWSPRVARFNGQECIPLPPQPPRWVGVPYHNRLSHHLASGLTLIPSFRVTGLTRSAQGWQVASDDGHYAAVFDWVVTAVPPIQSHAITAGFLPEPTTQMGPTFTLMLETHPDVAMALDWVWGDEVMGTLVATHRKPGRVADRGLWSLHATVPWSTRQVDQPLEWVGETLTQVFRDVTGHKGEVFGVQVHRWLYASVVTPPDPPVLDQDIRLGRVGDWTIQGDTWGALQSADLMMKWLSDAI